MKLLKGDGAVKTYNFKKRKTTLNLLTESLRNLSGSYQGFLNIPLRLNPEVTKTPEQLEKQSLLLGKPLFLFFGILLWSILERISFS